MDLFLRLLSLCVLLASAETVHGIARTLWVVPRLGKGRAQRWSVVSGSVLAFGLCYLYVPGLGLHGSGALLGVGAVLALFMASFDVALGRYVLKRSWRLACQDLNPARGNYLLFGLLLLLFFPWWVMVLRG